MRSVQSETHRRQRAVDLCSAMEGIPSVVPLGPCVPSLWPCWATEEATSLFDAAGNRLPICWGLTHPAASPRLLCLALLGPVVSGYVVSTHAPSP